MNDKKRTHQKFLLPSILAILILASSTAFADREALPEDRKVVSPNGQYVLVMLDPERDWTTEDKFLRHYYPSSGLYKNDGSKEPFWTIDWHSFEVYLSSDGQHVVRLGPWPRVWDDKDMEPGGEALKQPAVGFYKEGKLLKGYTIGDLIKDPKALPQTVSHFRWKLDEVFDDEKGHFIVTTYDGQRFVFDIYTGEIVTGNGKSPLSPPRRRGPNYKIGFPLSRE